MSMDEIELTKGQRLAGNLTAGGFVIACGLFLLLAGVGVIPLKVTDLIVPCALGTVGLVLIMTGLIQKNTVSLWISFAFLVPSLVSFLAAYTPLTYGRLYPLYIAIPAVASLFTMLMSREFRDHLRVILFFGLIAGIFALKSSGLLGWSTVLPIMVIFVGLVIVYVALKTSKASDEEND